MSLNDDFDDGDELRKCPYCFQTEICEHVLLSVDKTFRVAVGGVLMDAFNTYWNKLREEGGDEFDEREPFDELLDEVDSLADASSDCNHDGGPGMSSQYTIYYGESPEKVRVALLQFEDRRT